MSAQPSINAVEPIIPGGPDLLAQQKFYTTHLGFTVGHSDDDYLILYHPHSETRIHFFLDKTKAAEMISIRLNVVDIESLWNTLSPLEKLEGGGKVHDVSRKSGIETKPWGTKEFSLLDPAGTCVHLVQR
ncbi:hypothetical protein BJ742DRAFT_432126 [Cladochytrium replicatum]|nr:hypothetical protein BJ742DRAFT_432126 [Cladochytrium replicatum]